MKAKTLPSMALLLTTLSFSPLQAAIGDSLVVSLAGVASDTADEIDNRTDVGPLGLGAGALVEANVYNRFAVETGAMIIDRTYTADNGSTRTVQQTRRLHIPVLARVWATDFFALGAGPFAGVRAGDTKTSVAGTGAVASTSATDRMEYGLDAAATLNAAINNTTGLFLEGRYSALFDERPNESADELYGLAGVKINI